MKGKNLLLFLGFLLLGTMIIGLAGCGQAIDDEVSYYNPNWTPEGLIYAKKVVAHFTSEWAGLWFGGMHRTKSGEDTYYVTMDTNGNNEQILLYPNYPYFSPKGTYVCYVDSVSKFHIIRRSDNQEVYSFQPTIETISELDWGPNEDKLVYLKSKGDISITNIDGLNNYLLATSGESVSWQYGNNIAFQYLDGLYTPLAVIRYDGANRINLWNEGVSSPTISSLATNEIYGSHGTEYGFTDINISPPKYSKLFDGFSGSVPKANFSKNKIVYSNNGGGIWLIDFNGSEINKIK